jgi:hypothetical protein
MRSLPRVLAVLVLSGLAAACSKAPAEKAVQAADAAVESARPDVEKYTPAEWKSLNEEAQKAHSQFEQGQYKEALTTAQALVPRAQAAVTAAQAKKKELTSAFESMRASLPGALETLQTQLATYAKAKKLPAGIDKAAVEAANTELPNVSAAWTSAVASYDSGDVVKAVDVALEVRKKIEDMSRTFLPPGTAAPAPAA